MSGDTVMRCRYSESEQCQIARFVQEGEVKYDFQFSVRLCSLLLDVSAILADRVTIKSDV